MVERLVYTEREANIPILSQISSPAFSEVKRPGGAPSQESPSAPKRHGRWTKKWTKLNVGSATTDGKQKTYDGEIRGLNDLLAQIAKTGFAEERHAHVRLWFRGHSKSDWPLQRPSLAQSSQRRIKGEIAIEQHLTQNFRGKRQGSSPAGKPTQSCISCNNIIGCPLGFSIGRTVRCRHYTLLPRKTAVLMPSYS